MSDKIREALEIGKGYIEAELARRKEAMAGYSHRWISVERDLAAVDAALAAVDAGTGVCAEQLLTGNEATLHAEVERLRAELKARHKRQHDAEQLAGEYLMQRYEACAALATQGQAEPAPGFKLVAVKGFDELIQALDRAECKGYLPDALADEWGAFDWLAAAPQPNGPAKGSAK